MEVLGMRGAGDGLRPYLFTDITHSHPCESRRAHVSPMWGARKPSPDVGATPWTPTIKAGVSQTVRISSRRRSTLRALFGRDDATATKVAPRPCTGAGPKPLWERPALDERILAGERRRAR